MTRNSLAKIFLLMMFLQAVVYTQNVSKTGTTAASFLEISVGAAASGMGGAFVSKADDATALFWNVAGTAGILQNEVVLVHTNWIADTRFDFAGVVIPLGGFGNIGFSITSLTMDDMKVRTVEKPDGTGEYFGASDMAVGLSYSRKLSDRFNIGFTAKYIQQSIWHMNASAFAIDVGTTFRTDLLNGMVIGASISNFGTKLQMNGRDSRYFIRVDDSKDGSNDQIPTNIEMAEWDLPLNFQIGVSTNVIQAEQYRLTLAVDALHPSNDYESMNVGAEFAFNEYVFLRGGYQSLFLKDAEGGLSFGIGANSKMIFSGLYLNFDYAFRDFGRLEEVHTFSIRLSF
jgi:hypothetical protein